MANTVNAFGDIVLDAAGRKAVKPLIQKAYPNYKGRKVRVTIQKKPMSFLSTWDEGSKDYYVAIDLRTLEIKPVPTNGGICEQREIQNVTIPPGVAVIMHTIFQGKDCGMTIYINPESASFLEAAPKRIGDVVDADVVLLA